MTDKLCLLRLVCLTKFFLKTNEHLTTRKIRTVSIASSKIQAFKQKIAFQKSGLKAGNMKLLRNN